MKKNVVTVLMSVYKEDENWMRASIESILNQTYSDFDFIIINDNPDRTLNDNIVEFYAMKDSRIRYYKNDTNIGLARTLNKGLQLAKGKYIARMDADDISMPTRLAKQIQYMESNPDCVVCGTKYKIMGKPWKRIDNICVDSDSAKAQLVLSTCFGHPTVMIRKEVLDLNGLKYDIAYDNAEDYKIWADLSWYGSFYNIPENLLEYRLNYGGVSKTKTENQLNLAKQIRRDLIEGHLSKIMGESYVLPKEISLDDLKYVRQYLSRANVLHNKILTSLYLSLSDSNFKGFSYFIFSFDFLKVTFYYFLRVLKQLLISRNEFVSL